MSFTLAKKHLQVTTYHKVVFLLLLVSGGFLLLLSSLYYYNQKQQQEFQEIASRDLEREVNGLLDINSDSYVSLINEITYWDDFVKFVQEKNIEWFDNSVVYLIDTYKADYIDVYTMKEEFITKASTLKVRSENFIPKSVFPKLEKERIIKFYTKIPEGIVVVYGATIHSSTDPFKNKTAPKGYFFIAKLLDDTFFINIKKTSNASIDYYKGKESIKEGNIYYLKDLKDTDGKKIDTLLFQRKSKVDFSTTRRILYITLIGFLLAIGIFFYFARRWAKKPMSLIKKVLEQGDLNAIEELKVIKGEFRHIATLFEQNHHQKIRLQQTKLKAEESDKLKSAFLMNLSHEIRTPMNAIMGFSDLLSKKDLGEDEKEKYIEIIKKSGSNLIAIIDDLVEMSKIDSDLIKPKYSSFNLNTMLQATFDAVKITMDKKKNITFKFIAPKDLLTKNIISDVVKLNQIVTNLLSNAIKFTDEGFIILDYEINYENETIDFLVKDSGIGIADEQQEKIFIRFSKIDFNENEDNNGLGLGLAISKAYLEMLGGTIALKSEIGVGSTFLFSIPLKIDERTCITNEGKSINDLPLNLGDKELILVAEDDNINFILIEKLLTILNFSIIRAKNGEEAVLLCKENKEIDLVLMDIKMPILDGYQAFLKIREFNTKLPIIAQTSYSFPEEIEKIKEIGFNDYITKPIEKEEFFMLIKKYMKK